MRCGGVRSRPVLLSLAVAVLCGPGDLGAAACNPVGPPGTTTPTITKDLFADVDHDCAVGIADFLLLLADWGPCADCGTLAACPADLDGNRTVGILDFLALLGAWEAGLQ